MEVAEMSEEEVIAVLQEMKDRREIEAVLVRYCRAVDRLDAELLRTCYHPEAVDDHGIFKGTRDEFIAWVMPLHEQHQTVTQHKVSNITIEIDGDTAHSESYYMYAGMNKQGTPLTVCGGRYIDRFERREGRWAIAARISLLEWQGTPGEVFVGREQVIVDDDHQSRRDREDPSYRRPLSINGKPASYRIVPR
jgi:SnoaL-like domain